MNQSEFLNLPSEIVILILDYLPLLSLVNLTLTCHQLAKLIGTDEIVCQIGYRVKDRKGYFLSLCQEGRKDFVKVLLDRKWIDLTIFQDSAVRSFCYRAFNPEITEILLLNFMADSSMGDNFPNELGIPLACHNGHLKILKLLLDNNQLELSGAEMRNFIFIACRSGQTEILEFLLSSDHFLITKHDNFNEPEYGPRDPLFSDGLFINAVCKNNQPEALKVLLRRDWKSNTEHINKRFDPSVHNNDGIKWAARYGHVEIVKILLENPMVDPSDTNDTALRVAVENDHPEVVKILLEDPRVDSSVMDNSPIYIACERGYLEMVKVLLLYKRVDPSNNDNLPLCLACKNGHLEIVIILLEDPRVNPSAMNNYPVYIACKNGHHEIVKVLLLDKRVDPSVRNNIALNYAIQNSYPEIVNILLQDERVQVSLTKRSESLLHKLTKKVERAKPIRRRRPNREAGPKPSNDLIHLDMDI